MVILKASRADDAEWSLGQGALVKVVGNIVHRQPDMKEAFHFPSLPEEPSTPFLSATLPLLHSPSCSWLNPGSGQAQQEHVEAENRLHSEAVILYLGVYM